MIHALLEDHSHLVQLGSGVGTYAESGLHITMQSLTKNTAVQLLSNANLKPS